MDGLFYRAFWPPELRREQLEVRLMNKSAWPDGLTDAEREALQSVADFELVSGELRDITPRIAELALNMLAGD